MGHFLEHIIICILQPNFNVAQKTTFKETIEGVQVSNYKTLW